MGSQHYQQQQLQQSNMHNLAQVNQQPNLIEKGGASDNKGIHNLNQNDS